MLINQVNFVIMRDEFSVAIPRLKRLFGRCEVRWPSGGPARPNKSKSSGRLALRSPGNPWAIRRRARSGAVRSTPRCPASRGPPTPLTNGATVPVPIAFRRVARCAINATSRRFKAWTRPSSRGARQGSPPALGRRLHVITPKHGITSRSIMHRLRRLGWGLCVFASRLGASRDYHPLPARPEARPVEKVADTHCRLGDRGQ